jgi:hypothetical protein
MTAQELSVIALRYPMLIVTLGQLIRSTFGLIATVALVAVLVALGVIAIIIWTGRYVDSMRTWIIIAVAGGLIWLLATVYLSSMGPAPNTDANSIN